MNRYSGYLRSTEGTLGLVSHEKEKFCPPKAIPVLQTPVLFRAGLTIPVTSDTILGRAGGLPFDPSLPLLTEVVHWTSYLPSGEPWLPQLCGVTHNFQVPVPSAHGTIHAIHEV